MHPRNQHTDNYNFDELTAKTPSLKAFVKKNPKGRSTIDFSNPSAVKTLNAALLVNNYNIDTWDIPDGYLCPPIPGRADYIHHIADLLARDNNGKIPKGKSTAGLDIGTGANLIYPIIGSQSYGWRFVGSEVDKTASKSANLLIQANKCLEKLVSIRRQKEHSQIFHGVIQPQDKFAFTLCNPPFHASAKAAAEGSERKNRNLTRNKEKRLGNSKQNAKSSAKNLNFAGKSNELWCKGGELTFIKRMILESQDYANQVQWFTSLVSKKDNLKPLYSSLEQIKVAELKTVQMEQGSKVSRFIAWRF